MNTYQASGVAPVGGIVLCLLSGVVAGAVIGALYGALVAWIPFVYLNVLLTIGAGSLAGVAIAECAKLGKVRNATVLWTSGLISGLVLLYAAWAIYPAARLGFDNLLAAFHPNAIWRTMQQGFDHGFWTIGRGKGMVVDGWLLVFVWIMEAMTLVIMDAILAHGVLVTPFCERCDTWTKTKEGVAQLANLPDGAPELQQLMSGDFSVLESIPRKTSKVTDVLRLDLHVCTKCEQSNYLTLTRLERTKNKKGELETKENHLVFHLVVPTEQLGLIVNAGYDPPSTTEDGMPNNTF